MKKLAQILMCGVISLVFTRALCGMSNVSTNPQPLSYNLVNGLPNVYLSPMSEKIGHTWTNGNVWEKNLIERFYFLLKAHEGFFVAIDLGAQTGCFSLLSKFFPNSQWYSFEPIKEASDTLKQNLLLNDIQNVSVQEKAAADFSGNITLKMPNMNEWGLSTMGSNVLRFVPVMERPVECVALDSFVETHNVHKVHFMKLDTEGSELFILRGAKKMIMRDHPIILMEYNETNMRQCGVLKKDVDQFLKEMGYEWQLVSSEDILCVASAI